LFVIIVFFIHLFSYVHVFLFNPPLDLFICTSYVVKQCPFRVFSLFCMHLARCGYGRLLTLFFLVEDGQNWPKFAPKMICIKRLKNDRKHCINIPVVTLTLWDVTL
jgi:hypothetical protein